MQNIKHTFVINLDHQKDRLNAITKNLVEFEIPFSRIPGVYGKDVDQKMRSSFCNMACSNGMLGCYQAHVNVWKTILSHSEYKDTDVFLVLEDDSRLNNESVEVINSVAGQAADFGFDVLSLWNPLHYLPKSCTPLVKKNKRKDQVGKKEKETKEKEYRVCAHPFLLTTSGYIVTRKGAENTLNALGEKSKYHVDVCMLFAMWFRKIKYYALWPNVISMEGFEDSSIAVTTPTISEKKKNDFGAYIRYVLNVPVFSIYQRATINLGCLAMIHGIILFIITLIVPNFPMWLKIMSLSSAIALILFAFF